MSTSHDNIAVARDEPGRQAVDRLAVMLATHCRKGFFGKVSVEVFIEDGVAKRMAPAVSESCLIKH